MKSLEIVNRKIANLDEDDLWTNGELNIIKQDLEVLEIIKKKKVDVNYLVHSFNMSMSINATLEYYNNEFSYKERLTLEELLKIKQWLEENQNETCN